MIKQFIEADLLVQLIKKAWFADRVSERVGLDPTIVRKVLDGVKDLSRELTDQHAGS